jgi:hypothetical protein
MGARLRARITAVAAAKSKELASLRCANRKQQTRMTDYNERGELIGDFDPETKKAWVKPVESDDTEYECPESDCTVSGGEAGIIIHLDYTHGYAREEARRIFNEEY